MPELAQDRRRLARLLRRVRRDAGVQRLALAHGACRARPSSPRAACRGRSGASRRCRRSRGPSARGSGRGSRAGTCASPTRRTGRATCRSRPSSRSPARRGTAARSSREEPAEVLLGRAVRRPVVVREVEVRDAEVERAADDRALRLERPVVAEVVPEPERDRGQLAARCGRSGGRACGRSGRRRRRSSSGDLRTPTTVSRSSSVVHPMPGKGARNTRARSHDITRGFAPVARSARLPRVFIVGV